MSVILFVLGFFQKSGRLRMLMVKVGGWVSILQLLTDAYVRMGGWVRIFELLTNAYVGGRVGGYGEIPCLRNMWMTPKLIVHPDKKIQSSLSPQQYPLA